MDLKETIKFRELSLRDCKSNLLENFNRYQKINRYWKKENGKWMLKDIFFIQQWDNIQKAKIISTFIWRIEHDGYVLGAFVDNHLIGFGTLDTTFFGSNKQYIQLELLHVSYEYRNKGIGKKLFSMLCHKANQIHVKKLYISANSSEQSQAFYKRVGCVEAKEINQDLADKEPYDCQMEYIL